MVGSLKEFIVLILVNYHKFYNDGNSAAGTRVRKVMQAVKLTAQDVRLHVQETKNSE